MRILVMSVFVVAIGLAESPLLAQSAEIEAPDIEIMLGVATVSDEDDGKLAFHFVAGAPVIHKIEMVTRTYTVVVPYVEQVERDGKMIPVTKTRNEERTSEVPVTRPEVLTDFVHSWNDVKIQTVFGDEVSVEDAKVHFQTRQPIVAIYSGTELSEFYTHVLHDEVLVVVLPRPKGEGVLDPAVIDVPGRR